MSITATAESLEQAQVLLDVGVDYIYAGCDRYGLRLPHSFEGEEMAALVRMVHEAGKKIIVPVTAIMHPDKMETILEYLKELERLHVDGIEVGDAGVIYLLRHHHIELPLIYNAQMIVTNARQINFWAKRGATKAVLGREVPYAEMEMMADELTIPVEILVYGATCIHQSLRPLITNYKRYIKTGETKASRHDGLFLSEPKRDDSHYSIYEDEHGTHIFANNDLDLMLDLDRLHAIQFDNWKLEGLYTPGESFVKIAALFVQAQQALKDGTWNEGMAQQFDNQIHELHPKERGLDNGFFDFDPKEVQ